MAIKLADNKELNQMLILTTASTGGGNEDKIILPIIENFELFIRNKF